MGARRGRPALETIGSVRILDPDAKGYYRLKWVEPDGDASTRRHPTVNVQPAVTTAQWRVLVLAFEGASNVSDVAEDLGVHRSNASRVFDRLVEAGLLRRQRSTQDKRHVLLALTPAGRRLFDRAMERDAMSRLTEEERNDLARCFSRLVEAAGEVKMTRRSIG